MRRAWLVAMLCCALPPASAPAQHRQVVIYRCTDAGGHVTLQNDVACPRGTQQRKQVVDVPPPMPTYQPREERMPAIVAAERAEVQAAINQALRIARMGGAVSLLGIPTNEAVTIERFAGDLIFKGLSLQAIIGRRIFSTWDRMLELLADGLDLRPLVSREYDGLDAFIEGMEAFDAHEALKVVFYPHGKNGDGHA